MKKNLLIIFLCTGAAFFLAECKKKAAQARVETIAGVTYIHNAAKPLHPAKAVTFEEDFTFREKDEAGEVRIFKPDRFAVDAEDNIYISDDSDMAIKVFDAEGKYVRTMGRRGNGPGEFEAIGDMAFLPDGRLLVTDYQGRRTSFFSPDGQFLTSFQWKKNYSRVYLATNSSYTVDEGVFSEDKRERWVKTINFAGEEILSFGKFTYPEMKMLRVGEGMIGTSVPWSPMSVIVGDNKNQWLYHCLNNKYVIEVYNQEGKLVRKVDRPYELLPVTGEDIQKLKSRFAGRPDSPGAKLFEQMELPKVKTIAERMLVDSDGNLWVGTNEEKKDGDKTFTAYDIFNPEGFYEARIWTDIIPVVFANRKMYRMSEDEATGLRLLKRYRSVWKEAE